MRVVSNDKNVRGRLDGLEEGEISHILLSMDPDAIKLPVGSNLAEKISPEWPLSSISGASRLLVLTVYNRQQLVLSLSAQMSSELRMTYGLDQGIAAGSVVSS